MRRQSRRQCIGRIRQGRSTVLQVQDLWHLAAHGKEIVLSVFQKVDPILSLVRSNVLERRLTTLVFHKELLHVLSNDRLGNLVRELGRPAAMVEWRATKAVADAQLATVLDETDKDFRVGALADQVDDTVAELIARVRGKTAGEEFRQGLDIRRVHRLDQLCSERGQLQRRWQCIVTGFVRLDTEGVSVPSRGQDAFEGALWRLGANGLGVVGRSALVAAWIGRLLGG